MGVVGAHNKMCGPRLYQQSQQSPELLTDRTSLLLLHPYLYSSGSAIPDTPPQLWDIIESQSWNLTYNNISNLGMRSRYKKSVKIVANDPSTSYNKKSVKKHGKKEKSVNP